MIFGIILFHFHKTIQCITTQNTFSFVLSIKNREKRHCPTNFQLNQNTRSILDAKAQDIERVNLRKTSIILNKYLSTMRLKVWDTERSFKYEVDLEFYLIIYVNEWVSDYFLALYW